MKRVPSTLIPDLFRRKTAASPYLSLFSQGNGLPYGRFAIVVSAKTAKTAVRRHLLKRRARALLEKMDLAGNDVVLNILPPANSLVAARFRDEVYKLVSRLLVSRT